MTRSTPKNAYNESAFKILEGLEPVKLRPGQFTHTEHPLHIVQEVIDNAVDEALAGHATSIRVRLQPQGVVEVADNGRGIPVGKHPQKKIPVIQAAYGTLYAGGKFDKGSGASAYAYSGGLHGVGVAVSNALSKFLEAEVCREGKRYIIRFENGTLAKALKCLGSASETGTCVRMQPDPKYFDSPDIPTETLIELLRAKAALLPGLAVHFEDNRENKGKRETFIFEKGVVSLLEQVAAGGAPLVPVLEGTRYAETDGEGLNVGEGAAWALSWYENAGADGKSFVNLIPTPYHGTHVSGLKAALFESFRGYIEHHGLTPKGVKLSSEDVFKNVLFVLSARLLDPAFANQTKDKLTSREAVKVIEKVIRPDIEAWLNHNPAQARVIADLAIKHATARTRAGAKVERRKSSGVVMLPGKLSDCESGDNSITELYLVEGDSAGGSAKLARDKYFQAIFPMRGKSLNTWEKDRTEALANEEIHDLSIAIGMPLHDRAQELDWGKLRYGKIVILSDADVDGEHIRALLLTLFFRHFPQLVERGHIYVASPPLYRLDVEAAAGKKPAKKIYAMDGQELRSAEERLKKEGYRNWRIGRFKGLGEMNPPELWETTLSPETRRLQRIALPEAVRSDAVKTFDLLMAKSRAGDRRAWMERRGAEIE
jgi:topoisomerase-4 subunit B